MTRIQRILPRLLVFSALASLALSVSAPPVPAGNKKVDSARTNYHKSRDAYYREIQKIQKTKGTLTPDDRRAAAAKTIGPAKQAYKKAKAEAMQEYIKAKQEETSKSTSGKKIKVPGKFEKKVAGGKGKDGGKSDGKDDGKAKKKTSGGYSVGGKGEYKTQETNPEADAKDPTKKEVDAIDGSKLKDVIEF